MLAHFVTTGMNLLLLQLSSLAAQSWARVLLRTVILEILKIVIRGFSCRLGCVLTDLRLA